MTVFIDGPRAPPARGGKADALVILLHGYGSNGADLISLAPFWAKTLPGAMFVAPNAIEPTPQAPGGYQWFGITSLDPHSMEQGVRRAAHSVDAFITRELDKLGLDASRLALVGFSQGTMMALHVGPRRAQALAGIVGFSGMLADPDELKSEVRTRPPVLLVHGDADEVLPVASLAAARQGLEAAGLDVVTHISPRLGHSIDEKGLQLGATFLAHRLSRPVVANEP